MSDHESLLTPDSARETLSVYLVDEPASLLQEDQSGLENMDNDVTNPDNEPVDSVIDQDNQTDRLGYWTKILPNNSTVSELRFIDEATDSLTPEILIDLEDSGRKHEVKAENRANALKMLEDRLSEEGGDIVSAIVLDLRTHFDSCYYEQLIKLTNQGDTTIDDIKRFYTQACQDASLSHKMLAASIQHYLDEIENGHNSSE